jgi:glycerate dehydrogenase
VNIVIVDSEPAFGSTSSQGGAPSPDIDCAALFSLGNVTVFSHTSQTQLIERAAQAQIVITNKVPLGAGEFSRLPELRMVSVLATGVNVVDLVAAAGHGVLVCNVPGYSTASTAQHTIALLLELVNHVGAHDAHVHQGHYQRSTAFSYFLRPLNELSGKTMGIIGLGAIGTRVAEVARALGMSVLVHTRTFRPNLPFVQVALETLLQQSDVVSIHCPLSAQTHHLINETTLAQMKRGAYLLNVARGPIVDESALADALRRGHLAGAGLDVLQVEPPHAGSPLLSAPRCIITPHIAWASVEARQRLIDVTAQNVRAYLNANPQNVVS